MIVTRSQRKARTRAHILKVARKLFSTQGYENTKTTEIANIVGISHGTVFAHFDSKASILRELVLLSFRENLDKLKNKIESKDSSIQKLKTFTGILWRISNLKPEIAAAYFSQSWTWDQKGEEDFQYLINIALKTAREIIEEGIEQSEISESIDIDVVIEILFSQFIEYFRSSLHMSETATSDEALLLKYHSFLDYLLTKG